MVNPKHQFDLYSFRPDHIKKLYAEDFSLHQNKSTNVPKRAFYKKN